MEEGVMKTGRTSTRARRSLPRSFAGLCKLHMLRPLQDEIDFQNAQKIADALAILNRRTRDQDDYLETLSTLMEKYEEEHGKIDTSRLDPIETLKYLMDGREMGASDLGRVLGHRELGPAILRRERQLSKANILSLSRY